MTIGNFSSREELNKAYEEVMGVRDSFNTIVKKQFSVR